MKNKTNKTTMEYILICLLYLTPAYLLQFKYIEILYHVIVGSISCLFIAVNYNFKKIDRQKISTFYFIVMFYFIILCATVINGNLSIKLVLKIIIAIGFFLFIFRTYKKGKILNLLKAISFVLGFLVLVNLFTVIIFPNGLYRVYGFEDTYFNPGYLLGHRNNAIEYCIPYIGMVNLIDIFENKYISVRQVFAVMISLITVILTKSSNAIICIVFIIGADCYLLFKSESKIFSIINEFFISLLTSILLIFFSIQNYFSYFIINILHKSLTLTKRTKIWSRSVQAIKEKILFGYGIEDSATKYLRIGHGASCHNYYLDMTYFGGIVLLIVMFVIILKINNRLTKINKVIKNRLSVIYGAYFILWIATPIHFHYLFIMFTFFIFTIIFDWDNITVRTKFRIGVGIHVKKNKV